MRQAHRFAGTALWVSISLLSLAFDAHAGATEGISAVPPLTIYARLRPTQVDPWAVSFATSLGDSTQIRQDLGNPTLWSAAVRTWSLAVQNVLDLRRADDPSFAALRCAGSSFSIPVARHKQRLRCALSWPAVDSILLARLAVSRWSSVSLLR